jgi:multidrug efflux pump subunit AcrA (membrane-fusion protein)
LPEHPANYNFSSPRARRTAQRPLLIATPVIHDVRDSLVDLSFAACNRKLWREANHKCAPPVKKVLVTKVESMDIPVQLHEFGRLSSPESANVQPQVSGRIMEVHFVEGQKVKKGDLLFVIDPRPFQADLEKSQG